MELNPASARLLELLRDNDAATSEQLLLQLERELGAAPGSFRDYGAEQLLQFAKLGIVGFPGA